MFNLVEVVAPQAPPLIVIRSLLLRHAMTFARLHLFGREVCRALLASRSTESVGRACHYPDTEADSEVRVHRHPLHRTVDVQCLCCHLVSRFHFTSGSDQVICKGCVRHQGTSAAFDKLRDRDHLQLWTSELDVAREDHREAAEALDSLRREADAQVLRLSEELSDVRAALKAEIGQRPVATVAHWFEADTVREALAQRDSAFRVRDRVMQSLRRVDELHHTDDDDETSCSCGRLTKRCNEWSAMTDLRPPLDKWERTQRERLFDGLEHSLSEDHPYALEWRQTYSMVDWRGPRTA